MNNKLIKKLRRMTGFEPAHAGSTIQCRNHLATPAKNLRIIYNAILPAYSRLSLYGLKYFITYI